MVLITTRQARLRSIEALLLEASHEVAPELRVTERVEFLIRMMAGLTEDDIDAMLAQA